MFQRGEPASYLPLLIVAVIFGVTIFLAAAATSTQTAAVAHITGATTGVPSDSGNVADSTATHIAHPSIAGALAVIVLAAGALAYVELGRKH